MNRTTRPFRALHRRTPIAACIASFFALSAPIAASATTWVVDSCVDDANSATTPGTLRYAVAHANDPSILQLPDVIDLSGLTGANACPGNQLTLTQSSISIAQSALLIKGPGAANLAIHHEGGCTFDYNCDDRVLSHYGSRTLVVQNLGISGGYVKHVGLASLGGCIRSDGSLYLDHVNVSGCSAGTQDALAAADGGAVHVAKDLTMVSSSISDNALFANNTAHGGGAFVVGNVSLKDSAIDGNAASGVKKASGGGLYVGGTLSLDSSTVSGNSATATSLVGGDGLAYGGGVLAKGALTSTFGTIANNTLTGYQAATGGGAKVLDAVTIDHTTISGNVANATSSAIAGGLYALGNLAATDTTLDGNSVSGDPQNGTLFGGGAVTAADISLVRSTISNNHSSGSTGGLAGLGGASTAYLQSSTISGNTASGVVGGLFFGMPTVKLYNTTVAFNGAELGQRGAENYAPGLALSAGSVAMSVTLQSSLLSNNTFGANAELDLSTANTNAHTITFNAGPAYNLVRVALVDSPLPGDTIDSVCPLLGPLRDNGGVTRTHALLSKSPAIDFGSNILGLNHDQRGTPDDPGMFPYPRMSNGDADIGAYEVDQDEIVFNAGFDGCPP